MIRIPERTVEVVDSERKKRRNRTTLLIGQDIEFNTNSLETYGCKQWEPAVYDAMVVAASVEYLDRVVKRPRGGWGRKLCLRICVHDPRHWKKASVSESLHEALQLLTGDSWEIDFFPRVSNAPSPSQESLPLSSPAQKVIPFSNGLDSLSVAGILREEIGDGLVLVRLGSKGRSSRRTSLGVPFLGVPYTLKTGRTEETSARSRGFRFALLGGIAAYLAEAKTIVVPESGQGILGPSLVTVAHAHCDYRNHPRFARLMETFLLALFGRTFNFEFPRLWSTKGETLREYVQLTGKEDWKKTESCWRNNRWSTVDGHHRPCGICAACMLRRMSIHSSGHVEAKDRYICDNLKSVSLREGTHPRFEKFNQAFCEYACAGTLHLKHLAALTEDTSRVEVRHHASGLAHSIRLPAAEVEEKIKGLSSRHSIEWNNFLDQLGDRSFVTQWARGYQ